MADTRELHLDRPARAGAVCNSATSDTGWWTDDTLGALVARALAGNPDVTVNVWSRSRPWHGTYADIDAEARRAGRAAAAKPASQPGGGRGVPVAQLAGGDRRRSSGWRWVATCSFRSSTSTVARRSPSSSSRAAPSPTSRPHRSATSTTSTSSTRRHRRGCDCTWSSSDEQPAASPTQRRARAVERAGQPRPRGGLARRRGHFGRRAGLHVGHDERPEGRDPRSPHDAQRAAPHGGLDHARVPEPDGLPGGPRHRDARRRARPDQHRRRHPRHRPLGSGSCAGGDAGGRGRGRDRGLGVPVPACSSTPISRPSTPR